MRKHDFYYNSQTKPRNLLILAIFCLAFTTFAVLEVTNIYNDEPTMARMIVDSFQSSNLEQQEQQETREEISSRIVTQQPLNNERTVRATGDKNATTALEKSTSYYEEQAPVVVYSKTDMDSSIPRRQMAEVPPRQDADEDDPYSKAFGEDYEGNEENDYYAQQENGQQEQQQYASPYYKQQQQQQQQQPPHSYDSQQSSPSYYRRPAQSYYRQSPSNPNQYYDDSNDGEQTSSADARASQYREYGNIYRKYPYETVTPIPLAQNGNNKRLSATNSDMQFATKKMPSPYRHAFPSYSDDYDYQSPEMQTSADQHAAYKKRPAVQQTAQYRTSSSGSLAEEKQEPSEQMDFLTIFKSLKTMWDLYQSFTSSWNTLAEKRNRAEELARQKYKQQQRQKQQQQTRINSKKPPKFNSRKNTTTIDKNQRKQSTATVSPTSTDPDFKNLLKEEENQGEQAVRQQLRAKVEPSKSSIATKQNLKDDEGLRDKRQATNDVKQSTDVAEGRYIKGDPLKGYYDFVITEGSYKFWAAFQVGTAILIIYSTFAAIYYSKVNPLVSDYDYTDYLGGGRSLDGGDVDFVDDDAGAVQKTQTKSWFGWLPRTSHSLKFILDAIDKLPTDQAKPDGKKEAYKNEETEISANEDERGDETDVESTVQIESSKEPDYMNDGEYSNESEDLSDVKENNKAM